MAQSLDEVRKQLRARLNELGPLVDEYAQLERAAQALGEPQREPVRRRRPSRKGGKTSRKRAQRGHNKQAIYAVIGERPGVSVGEISSVAAIAKPLVYNATRTGIQKGDLRKVDLGGGRSGFALARDGA